MPKWQSWAALFSICITTLSLITRRCILLLARAFCLTQYWKPICFEASLELRSRCGSFFLEQPYLHCFRRCLTSMPGKSPDKGGQSLCPSQVSCLSSDGALTSLSKPRFFQAMQGSARRFLGDPCVWCLAPVLTCPMLECPIHWTAEAMPHLWRLWRGSAAPGAPAGALSSRNTCSKPLECKVTQTGQIFVGIAMTF